MVPYLLTITELDGVLIITVCTLVLVLLGWVPGPWRR
jgi:hypothetical protein